MAEPNHRKKRRRHGRRLSAVGVALLCLLLSLTLALGTTLAVFTAQKSIHSAALAAKNYAVQVEQPDGTAVSQITLGTQLIGTPYTFTLTPKGQAAGYCRVTVKSGETATTKYIYPLTEPVQLSVYAAAKSDISFDSGWGSPQDASEENTVTPVSGGTAEQGFTLMRAASGSSVTRVVLDISETPYTVYPFSSLATLQGVAAHYGTTEADILAFNGLDSQQDLYDGLELYIPNPVTDKLYTPPGLYRVEAGDTLEKIAEACDVTIRSLCQWNNIYEATQLGVGMMLKIPVIYQPDPDDDVTLNDTPLEPVGAETEPTEPETNPTEPETTEPAAEPAASETTEPETEPAASETTEPETEPAASEATEPETEPTESETTEPETEPAASETTEPATEPAASETTEPETEPTEPETTEPETEPTEPETTEPETQPTEPEVTEPETEPTEPEQTVAPQKVTAANGTVYTCGVPLYYQGDYPDTLYGSGTVKTSGCSVTSLTMVANAITGYDYTVDELADYFGGVAENNIDRLEKGSEALGLTWSRSENWDKTYEALRQGKIVIALMDAGSNTDCLFTKDQHFIVLSGLTEDGRIMVNDPNRENYAYWNLQQGFDRGFEVRDILPGYSGAWIYERLPETKPQRYTAYRAPKYQPETNNGGLSREERYLLACLIWGEARGEDIYGQQAVAEVVLNRLASGQFGSNLTQVICGEGQFRSVAAGQLEKAEPTQAQYQAIDRALFGKRILPENIYYFAVYAGKADVYIQVCNHLFSFDES